MKVALYARVSTRDKEQNPETQLYALREYARRRDWDIVREYVDTASASDLRGRVQWRALLADVRKKDFDAILVLRLDRAFRSVKDTADTVDLFQHHKVGFISATQEFDTTSSMGRLLLNILAVLAEFESDLISERVREGMARAKAEGKHVGRPTKRPTVVYVKDIFKETPNVAGTRFYAIRIDVGAHPSWVKMGITRDMRRRYATYVSQYPDCELIGSWRTASKWEKEAMSAVTSALKASLVGNGRELFVIDEWLKIKDLLNAWFLNRYTILAKGGLVGSPSLPM